MKCPKCSSENKESSKYCYFCGSDLRESASKENLLKKSETKSDVKVSVWKGKQKVIIATFLSIIAVVAGVVLIIILSKENNPPGPAERFEVLCNRLYDSVFERPVPESFGDKKGEYNLLGLFLFGYEQYLPESDPKIIRVNGISTTEILKCSVENGEVRNSSIERKVIQFFDKNGLMTKERFFYSQTELLNEATEGKYFDIEYAYNSSGDIKSLQYPSVFGGDGTALKYVYDQKNRLIKVVSESIGNSFSSELFYNENGKLKLVRQIGFDSFSMDSGGKEWEPWFNEILYNDQGKIKRFFPVDKNNKPLDGWGYDVQYTESGIALTAGSTKGKKVIDGVTVLHSEIITYNTKGLVTSVLKYQNNELKEAQIYTYPNQGSK